MYSKFVSMMSEQELYDIYNTLVVDPELKDNTVLIDYLENITNELYRRGQYEKDLD